MNPPEEQVLRLLADPQNRAILTVLNDAAQPLTVSELVERLVSTDVGICDCAEDGDDHTKLQVSLHHKNLPKLEAAGLVDYDQADNVVSYERYPKVDADAEVLELELIDELLSYFSTGTDVADESIGVIEGREDVIKHGHHLVDEADDELFLMYVSADLLRAECLDHVERALDRGVDVSIGSTNPAVRDLAREQLPDATLWEPQLDWWNTPSAYPKVGRLVFADREKIMLAILNESDIDGSTTERAIIGDGKTDPLVVLVRQLLGPRLDHLDYQSEEFLDNLPFES